MLRAATQDGLVGLVTTPTDAANGHHDLHDRVLASLRDFLSRPEVSSGIPELALRDHFLGTVIPDVPLPAEAYIDFLVDVVLRHATNTGSPRCLGHMTGGISPLMRALGSMLVGLNQNLVKSEASKTLGLMERQTLAMLHRLVYGLQPSFYDEHILRNGSTLGVLASGGTLANLTALWCARNAAFPAAGDFAGVEAEGLTEALRRHGRERAVIIGSGLMHYSLEKAAGVLGLGTNGLLQLPVDERNAIRLDALEQAFTLCRSRGWRAIALVGVAGTTDCGSIDPLSAMADMAAREGVHFHVDAAWGAPLLFSETHRARLIGIERADTVTIDGHKQLYLPIGLSLLLFRDPRAAKVVEKQAPYMLRHDSSDLGKTSIEGSRSGMVLFAHAALHVVGRKGYGTQIDENLRKARWLADAISASEDFELLCPVDTNIVLYRHVPPLMREACVAGTLTAEDNERLNAHNLALQQAQHEAGHAYVSRTTLAHLPRYPGTPIVALRAVVINSQTSLTDMQAVLSEQQSIAARATVSVSVPVT